jgi:hypothetical protein
VRLVITVVLSLAAADASAIGVLGASRARAVAGLPGTPRGSDWQ